MCFKPRANGRNIVGCYMLRPFAHPVACCWILLCVVAQGLKPVKFFSQQLPTFLLFRDRRSVAQQCWIRLHSSSNIVGATHAHYAWFTKTYGFVASVCTPLPTRTQQLPTLLAQHVGSCCVRLHAALPCCIHFPVFRNRGSLPASSELEIVQATLSNYK